MEVSHSLNPWTLADQPKRVDIYDVTDAIFINIHVNQHRASFSRAQQEPHDNLSYFHAVHTLLYVHCWCNFLHLNPPHLSADFSHTRCVPTIGHCAVLAHKHKSREQASRDGGRRKQVEHQRRYTNWKQRSTTVYMLLTVLLHYIVFSPPNLSESPQLPPSSKERNNQFSWQLKDGLQTGAPNKLLYSHFNATLGTLALGA